LSTKFNPLAKGIRENDPVFLSIPLEVDTNARGGAINLRLYHSFDGGEPKLASISEGIKFYEIGDFIREVNLPVDWTGGLVLDRYLVPGKFSATGRFIIDEKIGGGTAVALATAVRLGKGSHLFSLYDANQGKFIGDITPEFSVVPGLFGPAEGSII